MQSYREEAASRPVSQLDPLPAPSGGDDMSKYRARYEEAMNPFEAFRGRVSDLKTAILLSHHNWLHEQEAARAYQALNPVERGQGPLLYSMPLRCIFWLCSPLMNAQHHQERNYKYNQDLMDISTRMPSFLIRDYMIWTLR
ncbi:hypothetical protein SERLADRAFT_386864, partial [Serpula lacrymans var. lacrymans S7.9]